MDEKKYTTLNGTVVGEAELKERYGDKTGNSLYLQILFPISPAVQAAKLAGLPLESP